MEITIGPYILSQRTSYSKPKLYDMRLMKEIVFEKENICERILRDYEKQMSSPDDYFDVDNNLLLSITDEAKSKLRYIFVPNGVEKIKERAFVDGKFFHVNLPEKLRYIGREAFQNCTYLKYLSFPNSLHNFGSGICKNCVNLERIIFPESFDIISEQAFLRCYSLKKIDIPSSVLKIDNYAFSNCINLKDVNIGNGVGFLGKSAFSKCKKLQKINLPNSLCDIEAECFSDCCALSEIVLPDNVIKLHDHIFSNVNCLTNINIPKRLESIDGVPFAESGIRSLTFNYDLKELYGNNDLVFGTDINKLVINKNVRYIDHGAFCQSGQQIKEIDYLGTEEELYNFMDANDILFDKYLTNLERINYLEKESSKAMETIYIYNSER